MSTVSPSFFASPSFVTYTAGATVNANRFVKFDSSGNAIQATTSKDEVIGVSGQGPISNTKILQVAKMDGSGVLLECGGTVAVGDGLTTDSVGRAVKAGSNDDVYAIARDAGVTSTFIRAIISKKAASVVT